MITWWDAAMLHSLSSKNVESTYNGLTFIVCDLKSRGLECKKQEVISIKPFRLKEIGRRSGGWRQFPVPKRSSLNLVILSHCCMGNINADVLEYSMFLQRD